MELNQNEWIVARIFLNAFCWYFSKAYRFCGILLIYLPSDIFGLVWMYVILSKF